MKVFLGCIPEENVVTVRSERLESEDGKVAGNIRDLIRPGEDFWGWSYDELMTMGSGCHELAPKPTSSART